MPLNFQQGKETLINTIRKDIRHIDYKRTCDIADMYSAFVTGEDVEKLLKRFGPRESEEDFAQRLELTHVITDYMAYRLMTPMFKVPRTLANKTIAWTNNKEQEVKLAKISKAMAKYAGDETLDDYLAVNMVLLDSTDPNSFIVTEFAGEVDPKNPKPVQPYPFEVSSHEAINYEKQNNVLQFLIVLNAIGGMQRYTIYLENDWIVAQEISLDTYKAKQYPETAEILFKDPDKKEAGPIFYITTGAHKAGRIPAVQIGSKKDLKTRKRTFVPMIHSARSFFLKSIKTISEFDLTNTLHTFPQKWMYDSVCPGDAKRQIVCNDGFMPDGEKCPVCKGTGFNEHKSAQHIIRVKMPSNIADVVSLENFSHYKTPPVEFLTFLKDLGLSEFPELAMKAVYSSEIFGTDQVSTTATEKLIDMESVYDTLKPFANKYSTVWKHMVNVIANYVSVQQDIVIDHAFPKDFKMKSVTMLLQDLSAANTSGAPSYVKEQINNDIAEKMYADDPDELLKLAVKRQYFPFHGKSESEIGTIINNNLTTNFNKILYANFDQIFLSLEQENTTETVNFYKMERGLQLQKIKEKVAAIADEIAAEDNSPNIDFSQAGADFGTGAGAGSGAGDAGSGGAGVN